MKNSFVTAGKQRISSSSGVAKCNSAVPSILSKLHGNAGNGARALARARADRKTRTSSGSGYHP